MLNLVIADSALETLPNEIFNHHSLKKIRKERKNVNNVVLDRNFHHFAMEETHLMNAFKRGRPDIVHIALVTALGSPLFKNNLLNVFVHTINNDIISIGRNLRIPKSYIRFEGLFLNLIKEKKIVFQDMKLMELYKNMGFKSLINDLIKPDIVVGFTIDGLKSSFEDISIELHNFSNPCIVIGGFPKGHFSKEVTSSLDKKYSIHSTGLEAHIVVSRMIYEFEKKEMIE